MQSLPSAPSSPLSNPTPHEGADENNTTSSGGSHESEPCVVVDLRLEGTEVELSGTRLSSVSNSGSEKACRICHISSALAGTGSEVIQLGCGCKNGLDVAHQHCAEAWFKIKGDRRCEICGLHAKNITGMLENRQFMDIWHGRAVAVQHNTNSSLSEERCLFWKENQLLCNIIIASVLVAFIVPWFLRVNML
ncbi:hypothetical protein LUZ63_013713 [Rhynchospora breviuscula]|uniref:RING-CH-type domain-containing protein n=1 Tax=Rhynchospora breviuscula TaxID=2022672 RepID=A0A9Q0C932_9POAL|nr:hypothetical protein LUZ63_013713 [Rhynchospora breviuscula]